MNILIKIVVLGSLGLIAYVTLKHKEKYWNRMDLRKHFIVGSLLSILSIQINLSFKWNIPLFLLGLGIPFLIGLSKELYDSKQKGNKFDKLDLLITVVGGYTSWALFILGFPTVIILIASILIFALLMNNKN